MSQGHPLILIGADRNLFTVQAGGSFTVPSSVAASSPTSDYVPAAVAGSFQNRRPSVGGQLLLAVTDDTASSGNVAATALEIEIYPGDVIALSAVAANKATLTINGEAKAVVQGTAITIAEVVGLYA